jgi:hypothetical protein
MQKVRINKKTGIVEVCEWGDFWSPAISPDGAEYRVNTKTGLVEENHSRTYWRAAETPAGREYRVNTDTGLFEENTIFDLWEPVKTIEGFEFRINTETWIAEENSGFSWKPTESSPDGHYFLAPTEQRRPGADSDSDAESDPESSATSDSDSSTSESSYESTSGDQNPAGCFIFLLFLIVAFIWHFLSVGNSTMRSNSQGPVGTPFQETPSAILLRPATTAINGSNLPTQTIQSPHLSDNANLYSQPIPSPEYQSAEPPGRILTPARPLESFRPEAPRASQDSTKGVNRASRPPEYHQMRRDSPTGGGSAKWPR